MESRKSNYNNNLPPGFRFHPTDEELIVYYLKNQAMSLPCPVSIIPEVNIYKFDPWQLPDKAEFGETEWYFFSPRDRKYPNGVRPNRAAVSGYWKATGTDKAIYSANKHVGIKKALVFYKGRPPKGIKTDWIMHEYRLTDSRATPLRKHGSMRLDDWVLCRIYRKKHVAKTAEYQEEDYKYPVSTAATTTHDANFSNATNDQEHHQLQQQQMLKFPRTFSLAHLLDLEYLGPISHLLNDPTTTGALTTPTPYDFQNNSINMGISGINWNPNAGDKMQTYQFADFSKIVGTQQSSGTTTGVAHQQIQGSIAYN